MKISPQQLEEIRSAVDIVDYIKDFVPLKKTGKNYQGLCPFHEEKTPSFSVNPEKRFYHCFGCGASGDVFTFAKEYKHLSFLEAVEEVAKFGGIDLKKFGSFDTAKLNENDEFYEVNAFAANYFAETLADNPGAKSVREYLKQRGIKPATQKAFLLGYSPTQWDALYKNMVRNKLSIVKAVKLGLIDKSRNNEYYDKFRGRLMFPIHTPNGRVAAFGGRTLDPEAKTAKYINSPESPIYSKRKTLYGLYFAKDEISKLDKAILVEGYMDVISLYQNGIKNVVAASGTSLTEDQVRLLSRYTNNIVVIFDADEAGKKAAKRSIEILLKFYFDVRLLSLPSGEDPDSFIRAHSSDDFNALVESAPDFLSYQAKELQDAGMLDDPVQKTRAIRELMKSLIMIDDELMRASYIQTISKNFDISQRLIEREVTQYYEARAGEKSAPKRSRVIASANDDEGANKKSESRFEIDIIRLLLSGNENIIGDVFDHIMPGDIRNKKLKEIAEIAYQAYMDDLYSPAAILERMNEELKEFAAELTFDKDAISRKWGTIESAQTEKGLLKFVKDIILKFQIQNIDYQIQQIKDELKEAADANQIRELLERNQILLDEKKELIQNNTPSLPDESEE
jgi:DNA primase